MKLSFSLEALIGGEISDSKETKKTIAKRCAVLVGKDEREQKTFYDVVQQYYKKRSAIVHGSDEKITEQDVTGFGLIVRQTAFALLEKFDVFPNIGDLQKWIDEQPFFLPTPKNSKTTSLTKKLMDWVSLTRRFFNH